MFKRHDPNQIHGFEAIFSDDIFETVLLGNRIKTVHQCMIIQLQISCLYLKAMFNKMLITHWCTLMYKLLNTDF